MPTNIECSSDATPKFDLTVHQCNAIKLNCGGDSIWPKCFVVITHKTEQKTTIYTWIRITTLHIWHWIRSALEFYFFSIRIFMGDWVIYSQSMINTLAHKHTHTHTPCKMRVRVRASERGGKRKETIYGTLQLHMYSTTITTNTRTHSQTIRYLLLWLCHPHYYCPFFIQSNREEIGTK